MDVSKMNESTEEVYVPPYDLGTGADEDERHHDERVKEAIKEKLGDIILNEDIIVSDGKKKIRIPLRYIEQYRFKYGDPTQGTGQGDGEPGDVVGTEPGEGQAGTGAGGEAGDEAGEHGYAEVTIDEVFAILQEDIGLPWLDPKQTKIIKRINEEVKSRRHSQSLTNLDKKQTMLHNLKRHASMGWPESKDGKRKLGTFHYRDIIRRIFEQNIEYASDAVLYMLMDHSGSMSEAKIKLAKGVFTFMARQLKSVYNNLNFEFILHDTQARHCESEYEFFHTSSSGGTMCSSAYIMARDHMLEHYPKAKYNIYVIGLGDGENWPADNALCVEAISELLESCQMVGYGEVYGNDYFGGAHKDGSPLKKLLDEITTKDGTKHPRMLSVVMNGPEDLMKVMEHFNMIGAPVSS